MALKLSIYTTISDYKRRGDNAIDALRCYNDLADEVVIINGGTEELPDLPRDKWKIIKSPWPSEFDWPFIGQQFHRGYEAATGDWVMRADLDYIFHEKDFAAIREAMELHNNAPALTFYKHQFVLPDRYNLKSRLVLATNKGKYGDRIKYDSGGDLCQPSLDGVELLPDTVPEAKVAFYNYEKPLKNNSQIKEDAGRMARAWNSYFDNWNLGGPDDESAFEAWSQMMKGRFTRPSKIIPLSTHPIYVQETIKNLKPWQFGHSGFGLLEDNIYV